MKGKPVLHAKTSFVDLDRRVEYANPYRAEQERRRAARAIVCHEGEVVVNEDCVVTK